MNASQKKPRKVRTTLSITKEAQDIMLDHGYASARTMGVFLSQLVLDYHARQSAVPPSPPTRAELVAELHRLIDLLAGE